MFFKTNLYKKYKKELVVIESKKEEYMKMYKENPEQYAIEKLETTEAILGYISSAIDIHLNMSVRTEQYLAALSLVNGKVIEMSTGEGKTLVGYLYAFHQLIKDEQVFIVTVNDYLVERDANVLKTLIGLMGRNTDNVTSITEKTPHSLRLIAYRKSKIIYISSQQLMFDNLKNQMVSNTYDFYDIKFESILLDEADLILLDESQNPFIIAGEDDSSDKEIHDIINFVKTKLKPYVEIKKEERQVSITDEGYNFLEENGYDILDYQTLGKIQHSMTALFLFSKDVDYVIHKNKIALIDAYTGRILDGRRLQDGLHQFIEAKENVQIQNENRTIRSMTYPHFFAKFKKFVGMSGTLTESRDELDSIYGLRIEIIPTHKPSQLTLHEDKLYETENDKLESLVEYVKEKKPQPILIVTTNIQDTITIEKALKKENIKTQTLNAYNAEIESQIISQAGVFDTVTIATNMAGRGTDIEVDEKSIEHGGLICIGYEHNNTSRIDRQLIGRTARNGNPGEAIFLTSLEDDWIPLFNEEYNQVIISAKNNEKKLRKVLQSKMTINDGFFKQFREQENRLQSLYGIHRDLLYRYREQVLLSKHLNESIDVVNGLLETSLPHTDKNIEIYEFKNYFIRKFDTIIPEYLNAAESLKQNIQFFQSGHDNPFTAFEQQLMQIFESLKESYFRGIVEEIKEFIVFEEKKVNIEKRFYLSPTQIYTYLFKNDKERKIDYILESSSKELIKETVEIKKNGLVELYLGTDLEVDKEYILTMKENGVDIDTIIIKVLALEELVLKRNQAIHYYLPNEIIIDKKSKRRDYLVMNEKLEIIENIPYATTGEFNNNRQYKKGKYKMLFVTDDSILFVQEIQVI